MRLLPITAKLNPFAGARFWVYLAASTALARLITGFARVYQNRPSVQDPSLSENEKRQACIERFFVEVIGTTGYLVFLHLGQDVVSKFLEPRLKKNLNKLLSLIDNPIASGLNAEQARKVKAALTTVYGDSSKDLISRYLYENYKAADGKTGPVALNQLKRVLQDELLFNHVRSTLPIDHFTSMMRHSAAGSLFGGVAASAIFGGVITQWLNDRVFAPAVRRTLNNRSMAKTQAVAAPYNAQPTHPVPPQAVSLGTTSAFPKPVLPVPNQQATPTPYLSAFSNPIPQSWSAFVGGLPR